MPNDTELENLDTARCEVDVLYESDSDPSSDMSTTSVDGEATTEHPFEDQLVVEEVSYCH